MSLFDAYVFIDWSAANRPSLREPTENAVWVGALTLGLHEHPETTYHRTRGDGVSRVLSVLMGHVEEDRRVLVGFDFPYGYPSGFARALGLPLGPRSWWEVWAQLARRAQDTPNNVNNRFAVAAELNSIIVGGGQPGPFWGCPPRRVIENLQRCSPGFPFRAAGGVQLPRLRVVEIPLPKAQETWKLLGIGSVGGQALVGIPYVHMLRSHCKLTGCSQVWPFETGFTQSPSPDKGPFILHAEIWPGVIAKRTEGLRTTDPLLIPDQAQVRATCEWAAELDARNELGQLFSTPNGLNRQQIQICIEEEGWILGAIQR